MPDFERVTAAPHLTASALAAWHHQRAAFERLVPPWETLRIDRFDEPLEVGAEVHFRARVGPVDVPWAARITERTAAGFVDEQVTGPFAAWRHAHRFRDGALEDHVRYTLRGGLGDAFVRNKLERLFRWRHEVTLGDLARHAAWQGQPRRRVGVTGATGLIGAALCQRLALEGHEVVPFTRGSGRGVRWDPASDQLDPMDLVGLDAIVHLAGAPISVPWTAAAKEEIQRSRVDGTRLLARAIAACPRPPAVLVSGSAIGVYGDPDGPVDEASPVGHGFLAEVGEAWEAATAPAADAGVRVAIARTGLVLSARGGFLGAQLPLFRACAGGPIGGGAQGVSWIGLDDMVDVLLTLLHDDGLRGPFNAVAPNPVSQRAFARTLGEVLGRPAALPTPAFAIRAAMGEMGDHLILRGAHVHPTRLREVGFTWRHDHLVDALRHELGVTAARLG